MVKYAERPTATVEIDIAAPPSAVWPILSDISTPARFSDEFQRAEWIDDGPALGATFRGYNKRSNPDMEWDVVCAVTACDEDRRFEWTIGALDNKVARWGFDLAPNGDGSTLRFTAEMGPGPSGLTPAIEAMPDKEEKIVANRLAEWSANMERTVAGIKELAESGTSA